MSVEALAGAALWVVQMGPRRPKPGTVRQPAPGRPQTVTVQTLAPQKNPPVVGSEFSGAASTPSDARRRSARKGPGRIIKSPRGQFSRTGTAGQVARRTVLFRFIDPRPYEAAVVARAPRPGPTLASRGGKTQRRAFVQGPELSPRAKACVQDPDGGPQRTYLTSGRTRSPHRQRR